MFKAGFILLVLTFVMSNNDFNVDNKIRARNDKTEDTKSNKNENSKNMFMPGGDEEDYYEYDEHISVRAPDNDEYDDERASKLKVKMGIKDSATASILIKQGENFTLPCVSESGLDMFIRRNVRVVIKGKNGNWKITYKRENGIGSIVPSEEATGTRFANDLPNPILDKIDTYICRISGDKICTINGEEFLCKNYKMRVEFYVQPLEKDRMTLAHSQGSLIEGGNGKFTCSKSYLTPTPADKHSKGMEHFVATNVEIIRLNEDSINDGEMKLKCTTNFIGVSSCATNNTDVQLKADEDSYDKFNALVNGGGDDIAGRYLCKTSVAETKYSQDLCSYNNDHSGVEIYNLCKCKDLYLRYEGFIYQKTNELKIRRRKTTSMTQLGDGGFDFEITALANSKHSIICVIESNGQQWHEYQEIKGPRASQSDVLRCCLEGAGCAHHSVWTNPIENSTIWNWIFLPMDEYVINGTAKAIVRLRSINLGDLKLYGLCQKMTEIETRSDRRNNFKKYLCIMVSILLTIICVTFHIVMARRKIRKYTLGLRPHYRLDLREAGEDQLHVLTNDENVC